MLAFLSKVWALARPYKSRLILGLCFSVLFALSNALLLLVVKLVPDAMFPQAGKNPVTELIKTIPVFLREPLAPWLPPENAPMPPSLTMWLIMLLPVTMLFRGIFSYLNIYLTSWAATRAIADLRLKLFDHLQNLSLDFFHAESTGKLISRIISDTMVLHNTIAFSLSTMVRDPVTIIVLLTLLLTRQRDLTLVSMIVFTICVVTVIIYGQKVRKSAKALQSNLADLAEVMHEAF